MFDFLRPLAGWLWTILVVAIAITIGAAPVALFGLAWGIIITVVLMILVGRLTGSGIDRAFATLFLWVLLLIGFVAGGILRAFFL